MLEYKNKTQSYAMLMDIKILPWDRHKNVADKLTGKWIPLCIHLRPVVTTIFVFHSERRH